MKRKDRSLISFTRKMGRYPFSKFSSFLTTSDTFIFATRDKTDITEWTKDIVHYFVWHTKHGYASVFSDNIDFPDRWKELKVAEFDRGYLTSATFGEGTPFSDSNSIVYEDRSSIMRYTRYDINFSRESVPENLLLMVIIDKIRLSKKTKMGSTYDQLQHIKAFEMLSLLNPIKAGGSLKKLSGVVVFQQDGLNLSHLRELLKWKENRPIPNRQSGLASLSELEASKKTCALRKPFSYLFEQ